VAKLPTTPRSQKRLLVQIAVDSNIVDSSQWSSGQCSLGSTVNIGKYQLLSRKSNPDMGCRAAPSTQNHERPDAFAATPS
jgi:hypothetical protein